MSMKLRKGFRLKQFRIVEELGSGGFGVTYRVVDESLSCDRVVKECLPFELAFRSSDGITVQPNSKKAEKPFGNAIRNFKREASLLASIKHPHIVEVTEWFEANGTAYYVMPFLEGRSLDHLIQEKKKRGAVFSPQELDAILNPVLDALEAMHLGEVFENGGDGSRVYHRDIKPANILISRRKGREHPVLIDFGCARTFKEGEGNHTRMMSGGFTPQELIEENGNLGPWTDLYSLAASVYNAIYFEEPPSALERHIKDTIRVFSDDDRFTERFGLGFARTLDRALSPRPEDRPKSVSEWREGAKQTILEATEPVATGHVGCIRSPYGSKELIEVPGQLWIPRKDVLCAATGRYFRLPGELPPLLGIAKEQFGDIYSPYSPRNYVVVSVFDWVPGHEVSCPKTGLPFLLPANLPEWETLEVQPIPSRPGYVASPYVRDLEFRVAPSDWEPGNEIICPGSLKRAKLPLRLPELTAVVLRPGLVASPYSVDSTFRLDPDEWIPGRKLVCAETGKQFLLPEELPKWLHTAQVIEDTPGEVISPFGDRDRVAIEGAKWISGAEIVCPHTGRLFQLPDDLPPLFGLPLRTAGDLRSPYVPFGRKSRIRVRSRDWKPHAVVVCPYSDRLVRIPDGVVPQGRVKLIRAVKATIFLLLAAATVAGIYFQRDSIAKGIGPFLGTAPPGSGESGAGVPGGGGKDATDPELVRQEAELNFDDPIKVEFAARNEGIQTEDRIRYFEQAIKLHSQSNNLLKVSELLVGEATLMGQAARPGDAARLLVAADRTNPIDASYYQRIALDHEDPTVRKEYQLKLAENGSTAEAEASRIFDDLIEGEPDKAEKIRLIRRAVRDSTDESRLVGLYRQGWALGDFESGEELFNELRRSSGGRVEAGELGLALLNADGEVNRRVGIAQDLLALSEQNALRWLADQHPDSGRRDEWRTKYVAKFGWIPEFADAVKRTVVAPTPELTTAERSDAAWQYFSNAIPEGRRSDAEPSRILKVAIDGGNRAAILYSQAQKGELRGEQEAPGADQLKIWTDFANAGGSVKNGSKQVRKVTSLDDPAYQALLAAYRLGNVNSFQWLFTLHSGVEGNAEFPPEFRNPDLAVEAAAKLILDSEGSEGRRGIIAMQVVNAMNRNPAIREAVDRHPRGKELRERAPEVQKEVDEQRRKRPPG